MTGYGPAATRFMRRLGESGDPAAMLCTTDTMYRR